MNVKGLWGEFRRDLISSDDLHDEKLWPHCPLTTILEVYDTVTLCGGFLAGGLPRYISSSCAGFMPQIDEHRDHDGEGPNTSLSRLYRYFDHGGDIDFFFPTQRHYAAAYALLSVRFEQIKHDAHVDKSGEFMYEFNDSMCGNATNVHFKFLMDESPIKLQLVKCRFDDVLGTLSDFDLTNSRVAVVGDDVIMDSGWLDLEKARTLHLSRVNSPFCIGRIKKYVKRHGYRQITSESSALLMEKSKEFYDGLKDNPRVSRGVPKWKYSSSDFLNDFRQVISLMKNNDLQQLLSIYSSIDEADDIKKDILHMINGRDDSARYHAEDVEVVPFIL